MKSNPAATLLLLPPPPPHPSVISPLKKKVKEKRREKMVTVSCQLNRVCFCYYSSRKLKLRLSLGLQACRLPSASLYLQELFYCLSVTFHNCRSQSYKPFVLFHRLDFACMVLFIGSILLLPYQTAI